MSIGFSFLTMRVNRRNYVVQLNKPNNYDSKGVRYFGCGYDGTNVFFTYNGELLYYEKYSIESTNMKAAICLRLFTNVYVNRGIHPFKFDLNKYINSVTH